MVTLSLWLNSHWVIINQSPEMHSPRPLSSAHLSTYNPNRNKLSELDYLINDGRIGSHSKEGIVEF